MSFWLELHCDSGLSPVDLCGRINCRSQRGDAVGMGVRLASNLQLAPAKLAAQARSEGWERRNGGWWCPECLKEESKS